MSYRTQLTDLVTYLILECILLAGSNMDGLWGPVQFPSRVQMSDKAREA